MDTVLPVVVQIPSEIFHNLKEIPMFQVAIVRYGKVCEMFTVNNLAVFTVKLSYLRKYSRDDITYFVMSEKDDCDLTSLSTGNVGEITKGLA